MRTLLKISCFVAAILGVGCQSIGPKVIEKSHPSYNDAVTNAIDRQLLMNIVRLKYRENPMFLEVSSVTENWKIGLDVGLDKSELLTRDKASFRSSFYGPKAVFGESQSPTISYRPVRGKEFIKHMMTPIPLNVTLGMASSGWKLQRVFNMCIERINDVENAPTASGPMPWNKPNYEKFYEMTDLLKELEDADLIVIGIDPENNQSVIMRIKENAAKNKRIETFKDMLGLDQKQNEFRFESNFLKSSGKDLIVRTRSLMGVLFYLSHAVDVPDDDVKRGVVQTTFNADGSVFDWANNASGTLLKVRCSKSKPENSFISVHYRNNWFYIEDNDLHSKSTFMFISTLFNLQAGEASSADVVPMLTIPVGGH
ncbi:MAG: hypothetical protein LBI81_00905 [Puniceicoccales bacterium]|nr:hypothetical protein [Puniceicoccales bacterium]